MPSGSFHRSFIGLADAAAANKDGYPARYAGRHPVWVCSLTTKSDEEGICWRRPLGSGYSGESWGDWFWHWVAVLVVWFCLCPGFCDLGYGLARLTGCFGVVWMFAGVSV